MDFLLQGYTQQQLIKWKNSFNSRKRKYWQFFKLFIEKTRAATGGVLLKKVFLKISKNSQENTYAWGLRPATLIKKRIWHRCIPVNFAKFLSTPFLQNTPGGCFWREQENPIMSVVWKRRIFNGYNKYQNKQ